MKKGIVMEINDEFLTLLTPDGQFLQAKKQKTCVLGEEIQFIPVKKQRFLNRFIGIKPLLASAAVLLIMLGSLLPIYQSEKAYAYMSIDVNPSIELGINEKMQVIKLTPYNNDGKKIITHIGSWEKTDLATLTQTIIREMKKQGYLKRNHSVIISTVRSGTPEEKTEEQLTKNENEIKKMVKLYNLNPIFINGSEKDMEKAHHLGITTGKYKEEKDYSTLKKEKPQQQEASQERETIPVDVQNGSNVNMMGQQGSADSNQNTTENNSSNNGNISSTGTNQQKASTPLTKAGETVNQQGNKTSSENNKPINEAKKNSSTNYGQMKKQENSAVQNHSNK